MCVGGLSFVDYQGEQLEWGEKWEGPDSSTEWEKSREKWEGPHSSAE